MAKETLLPISILLRNHFNAIYISFVFPKAINKQQHHQKKKFSSIISKSGTKTHRFEVDQVKDENILSPSILSIHKAYNGVYVTKEKNQVIRL